MIRLLNAYDERGEPIPGSIEHFWTLLAERQPNESISHQKMPAPEAHEAFVRSRPYCEWYIIATPDGDRAVKWVGAIYATHQNEIGIAIRKQHQRRGYATHAIAVFMRDHRPLPPIPGKRSGRFIANVAPENETSRRLFERLGGTLIQVTYEL